MVVKEELIGNAKFHDLFLIGVSYCSRFPIFASITSLVVLCNDICDRIITFCKSEVVFDCFKLVQKIQIKVDLLSWIQFDLLVK